MNLTLRPLADDDLDQLFTWESDAVAVALAAFTSADPSDRAAFDAHYARIRSNPDVLLRAIDVDGSFVGTIASFTMEGDREVTYWIGREHWGQGYATTAARALLEIETTRPLHGRAAEHNSGSIRVLEKVGFRRVGQEVSFAAGVNAEVTEILLQLD